MDRAKRAVVPAGASRVEALVAWTTLFVVGGLFSFYIGRNVVEAVREAGVLRVVVFLALVGAALAGGRIKELRPRVFGGVEVFFGLGALWDALVNAHLAKTTHGANVEWARTGVVVVAALAVADGWSLIGQRRAPGEQQNR